MGLLDKLTGTRPARPGVAPVAVDELRTVLLGLNRDTAPWHVRDEERGEAHHGTCGWYG